MPPKCNKYGIHHGPDGQCDAEEKKELLPCPFCGGEAYMHEGDTNGKSFYGTCSNCQTEGPFKDAYSQGEIPLARKDAAELWNTRTK